LEFGFLFLSCLHTFHLGIYTDICTLVPSHMISCVEPYQLLADYCSLIIFY